MNPTTLATFAGSLADASGAIIRNYYRTPFTIDDKQDASPVTIADREAEAAIRERIRAHYPDHGIIGEEFGADNPQSDYQWVIDPIDGTKSFMIGRPIFGTLIALTFKGEPILGIIDQPVTHERWVGVKGSSTLFNGKPVKSRPCKTLKQAILCTTSPELFTQEERTLYQKVAAQVKYVIYGGDCYSYALIAMGLVDMVIESGLKPYDFAALATVVTGAGGCFTDWQGKPVSLQSNGQVLALGDALLLDSVTALLATTG